MKKLISLFLLTSTLTTSAKLNENQCVNAIVGEASGEPYLAKVGVAAVIRTRGSLQGVYGTHANHHESAKVVETCRKAWNESETFDPTHGCNAFGGMIDDHYFIGKLHLKPVLTIGHTRFYKM